MTRGATTIRPFQVDVPEAKLTDLRRRIEATEWPEPELVPDRTQGVKLDTMKALARYWLDEHDWRKCEARLNGLPQFMTEIDGLDIHFIHVRSQHANALPMIVTHGWPGSIIEQLKIIEPLTDPTAFGGTEADAFDLVIPSLPGHGFSGKPTTLGWDPIRIARAFAELMERLGYEKFVAQGGDWGNAVTEQMALQLPKGLVAIHTNMPATLPDEISNALAWAARHRPGSAPTSSTRGSSSTLSGSTASATRRRWPAVRRRCTRLPIPRSAWPRGCSTTTMPATRSIARVFAGESEGLTRDDILDNVTLYWVTNTAVSSARLYWESKLAFFAPKGVTLPTAVSVFPDEIYTAPRSWTEKAYPNLIHYNRLPKGTHFAAWEQPELFTSEIRASFKSLR